MRARLVLASQRASPGVGVKPELLSPQVADKTIRDVCGSLLARRVVYGTVSPHAHPKRGLDLQDTAWRSCVHIRPCP
eukprot:5608919-Pyramimonas_sp.AAC.1